MELQDQLASWRAERAEIRAQLQRLDRKRDELGSRHDQIGDEAILEIARSLVGKRVSVNQRGRGKLIEVWRDLAAVAMDDGRDLVTEVRYVRAEGAPAPEQPPRPEDDDFSNTLNQDSIPF